MKFIYTFIDLGPYPDHGTWGPSLPIEETQKIQLQERFAKERLQEIVDGKALAIMNGGWCRLKEELGDHLLYQFKNKFPTDQEIRELNILLNEKREDEYETYILIPVGHDSSDCVPAVMNVLLYGHAQRGNKKINLTEILDVSGHKIISELLIPPVEKLNLRQ
ncbi:hypothetical protein KY306_01655 [Candidatus Woesearchaeota archaeon]|nr:hypothetical protein [Candidatus Woesearchaeota archaeon]